MTKRIIALLLALILTVGLLPTVALAAKDQGTTTPAATATLTPDKGYYKFDGKSTSESNADITLSKTAVDNKDGTYTVTLEATAKTKVQPKPTEVVFVLDASGSMAWCCKYGEHKNEWGGSACSHMEENKDLKSRWDTAKSAIQTMVSNLSQKLGDSVTFKYVVFDSEADVCNEKFQVWDEIYIPLIGYVGGKWVDVTAGGSTHLTAGVNKGIDQFSDNPDTVKALIIVADGDSDDGYPTQRANNFKNNGGTIYTVGFMFKNDNFDSLASDGCKFNANNTNELTTAMGTIESKIIGMIDDPLGDKVDLVANSLKLVKDDASSTQPDPTTKDNGRTITWTDKSGMTHVKLTYTVKLKDGVTTTVGKNVVALNGNATFNYSYKQGSTTVSKSLPFPKPTATVYVASLDVEYRLESETGNKVTVAATSDISGTSHEVKQLPYKFEAKLPAVGDTVTANGKTYYVKSVTGATDKANTPLEATVANADAHTITVVLTETAPTASVTINKTFNGLPEKYQPTPTITVKKDGKTIKSEATKELEVDLEPGTYTVEETIDNVTGFELVSTTLNNSGELSFTVTAGETKTLTLTNSYTVHMHSIKYTVTGDIPAGAPSAPEETSTAAYDSPQRRENPLTFDGYTFTGWTLKSPTSLTIADNGTFTMPDSDVVFEGYWTANTGVAYKVEHYWQNINNNDFTLHETENLTGTTGEPTQAAAKTGGEYVHFTPQSFDQKTIKADGSTVVKIYYTRNTYTVTYAPGDYGDYKSKSYSNLPYGAQTPAPDSDEDHLPYTRSTDARYEFVDWSPEVAETVTEDVTYVAQWREYGSATFNFSNKIWKMLKIEGEKEFTGADFEACLTLDEYQDMLRPLSLPTSDETTQTANAQTVREAFGEDWKQILVASLDKNDIYSSDTSLAGDFFLVGGKDLVLSFPAPGCYVFTLQEINKTASNVEYDDTVYEIHVIVEEDNGTGNLKVTNAYYYTRGERTVEGSLMGADEAIIFKNTIDTGKDDYYPIIIPTIINKDTGMLNKTDHFAYVIGYPDGTVHPNGQITRAEVATIFFRLLRDEVRDGAFTTSNSYSDVAYGKWYNNPISTMSALGIITGYPDGTFKPNKPITRAEFAAIAARFDETQSGKSATFSDVIGHWAAKEIGIAYYNDWIKGYPDGTFKPDQNITRAEAMTLINRVLERKPESPADLLTNMNKWTDNMDTSKWYYLDVQEATNSHGYTRKTFNYELWRQMLPDPDWSRYER